MRSSRWLVPLLLSSLATPAAASTRLDDLVRSYVAAHSIAGVPSFARQTGLACSGCHYQFLALTPFGRQFKLNGYTLTKLPDLTERDSINGGRLGLTPFSMLSGMVTAGVTHTKDKVPGTQNDVAALPQELSGFLAGRIAPKIGIFAQFTYAGPDGAFGIDNIDIRYADKRTVGGGTEIAYGLTLNNNPTIQDLWNSTPGWGFPFIGSEAAPSPAASPIIDGALSQNVLGLGTYALFANLVYAEFDVYRSAFQGVAAPSEADATGAIKGVAPYWRLAIQKDMDRQSFMVGTFGMHTSQFPADPGTLSGPRDTYSDIGIDAQLESKIGTGAGVLRGSWIREKQTLDATLAAGLSANRKNTLKSLHLNASYYPRQWLGVSGGYFDSRGTTDAILGKPRSDGFIGEVDLNPWENTRVGVQYTGYSKFDGATGSAASGNNTLFAFMWLAF